MADLAEYSTIAEATANRDAPDEGGGYEPPTLVALAGADRQFIEPDKISNLNQMSLAAAIGHRSALDHRRSDSGTSIDIKHRPEALRSDVFSVDLLEGNKHLNVDDWVKLSRLESLDYHTCHNELYKKEMERLKDWNYSVDSLQRWIIALMIGIVTGLIAFGIHLSIEMIQENKFTLKQYMVTNYGVWITWIMMFVFNLSIVLPGTLLVLFFSNAANSSGIPFVKSYQNGVKIPQAFNLKTLATKIIGCVSAVSSNMPVGPEGPMIHIGGMIGAGVSQSRSKTMGCELPFLRKFRNDKDRRDFIATGSACGVAAAFSAPIGGCLFAMEETSSFWSHAITWRTLFCCIVAAFLVDFVTQSTAGLTLNTPDALSHQAIFQVSSGGGKYLIFELIPFILLGVIGGLAGSAFIKLNLMVTSWRVRFIGARPMFRVLEVVFALFCWTTLVHLAPALVPCNHIPAAKRDSWDTNMLLRWTCTQQDEFNDLASLLSVSQTNALRNLLKQGAAAEFQPACLALFTIIYFFGAAMIAGSTLVSGLMVPFLIVGASYGRLMGVLMKTYVVPATTVIEPGLYALIGATSFFGGVSRMTISLSVIMLEITGDMTLLLPIMIAAMVAKWVGDRFTHSLYDLLIGIQSIPFLESEPAQLFNILDVSQVMSRNVRSFVAIPKIRDIVEMLRTTTHHGFPIVDTPNQPRLKGTILRTQLLVLLDTRVWHSTTARLNYSDFSSKMMNFKKTIDEIVLTEEDLDQSVSLEPYLNQSPFSVHEGFSLTIAFRLFRTMGLRHLPIVDQRNYVVGIITRKDLLEQVVEAKHAILVSKHQLQSGFRQVMKDLRSRTIQQHQDDLKTTVS